MIDKEKRIIVIMCAGLGTRMHELRTDVPKALIPIESYNDQPILGITLNLFQKYNFNQFLVIHGFLGHQIQDFISKLAIKDISIMSIDASSDYQRGSLHSLLHVFDAPLILKDDQIIIVIPGDTIFQVDLVEYISLMAERKDVSVPTMFYKEVQFKNESIDSNGTNSSNRTLSIMDTYTSNAQVYVSKIKSVKANEISPKLVVKQVIPIIILNIKVLSQLKNILPSLEKKTVVNALNFLSYKSELRIRAVKIPFPWDFYDIDTINDLKMINQNKEVDNSSSDFL